MAKGLKELQENSKKKSERVAVGIVTLAVTVGATIGVGIHKMIKGDKK